jgi:ERCC4-type nuclease
MSILIIIDDRERDVIPSFDLVQDMAPIAYKVARIEVADYAIVYQGPPESPNNYLIASIERKSYDDFAASLKDGRYENKEKMIKCRSETNCRLLFIIEGPAFPRSDHKYGKIPYSTIESATFHMMVRDNIQCIYSKNNLGTAEKIMRFANSMRTLLAASPDFLADFKPLAQPLGIDQTGGQGAPQEINTRIPKSDDQIIHQMWSAFKGINVISAPSLAKSLSFGDLIQPDAEAKLKAIVLSNGRHLAQGTINNMLECSAPILVSILSAIPKISKNIAIRLVAAYPTLKALIEAPNAALEAQIVTDKGQKLGPKKTSLIKKMLTYTTQPLDQPNQE